MIRLKNIGIKNYRSLVNTNLSLSTNFTALIGANGAGKTNLLSSILLLKQISKSDPFAQRRFRRDAPVKSVELAHSALEAVFQVSDSSYSIKADLYFDTSDDKGLVSYVETQIRNLSKKGSRYIKLPPEVFLYLGHFRQRSLYPRNTSPYLTRSPEINEALYALSGYLANISYYSATQFSDPSNSPISLELEDKRLNSSRRSQRNHERFLYDLFTTYQDDQSAFRRYANAVGELGLGLVDKIDFAEHELPSGSIKVFAGGQFKKTSTNRTIVIPTFTVDDLPLSPNQLSEGTFKTLALVYYILNDTSDLLLIEEPEVCVHHGLLGSIIELIKIQSKTKQIVISTHSDYVLDKLRPENVVLVRKTKNGTVAETINEALSASDYKALHVYLDEIGNLGEYWKESGFSDEQGK